MRASTSSVKAGAFVVLAALAAFAPALQGREFFHDDRAWIVGNPLLHRGWRALPAIFTSGYVEPVLGSGTPIQEYRPLLTLSFLLQTAVTGFSSMPMRAANILLHAIACVLLWLVLRRRMSLEAATAGAALFAVLPVHAEAVVMVSWRSEMLTAISVLSAWLCLEDGRPAAACALYSAGMLVKEHSILFPIFYALADWTDNGKTPWERRRVYSALLSCAAAYLAVRAAVLSRFMHGGVPYFDSRLTAALTLPVFFVGHYLWPSATGLGLCSDFSRPLIPDQGPESPLAWLCLAVFAVLTAIAVRELAKKRAAWAFWLLGPCLFLLPTAHVIFPLDTIGAQRFLYIPTLGLAWAFGSLFVRLKKRRPWAAIASALILGGWYAAVSASRAEAWSTPRGFYEAAVACNPVSGRARDGLGEAFAEEGRAVEAREQWWQAVSLAPLLADPFYNLARLEWDAGNAAAAETLARRAVNLDRRSADAWVLLGLALESRDQRAAAEDAFKTALEVNEDDALAHYNLGHLLVERGDVPRGAAHLSRFAALAPDDPDAGKVRELLKELDALPR